MSFRRELKDSFDHAPLWCKIFIIIFCILLIVMYIVCIVPVLTILTLVSKKDTMSAVSKLIIKELLNPFGLFDIFFGD